MLRPTRLQMPRLECIARQTGGPFVVPQAQISRNSFIMPEIIDDKSEYCIPFILNHLHVGSTQESRVSPLFIGINGIQGAGKTVLVRLHR